MLLFLLRRTAAIFVSFLFITALLYGITMLAPPEARARLYMSSRTRPDLPAAQEQNYLNSVIRQHGLNDPYPLQYGRWLLRLARGEWGWSPLFHDDVLRILRRRSAATVELTALALLLFVPMGLMAGMFAGWRQGRLSDGLVRFTAYISGAIPPFILGLVLISVFYVGLHWFLLGRQGSEAAAIVRSEQYRSFTGFLTIDGLLNSRLDVTLDALRHLFLPALTLAVAYWALLTRLTRAGVVEETGKEYVVAAQARGLPSGRVVWRHVFPNAAAPALTSTALTAASLVTGVYVIESVFDYPGVSDLIINSMGDVPDVTIALGFAVYSVIGVALIMLLLDIVQAFINPILRHGLGIS